MKPDDVLKLPAATLRGTSWTAPEIVAGFSRSSPNATLMALAGASLARLGGCGRLINLGCGAGRNTLPLATLGWDVVGIDLSLPMLNAVVERLRGDAPENRRVQLALASMDAVPVRSRSADFIVAHGIWNLARSSDEFRRGVAEAARTAKPEAALFVFTFSRHTLPDDASPSAGEPFVFTQFSGEPQCFLTEAQLVSELEMAGFTRDADIPLRELNRLRPGALRPASPVPVIYEGLFGYTRETV